MINSVNGPSSVHMTHGILMQEVIGNIDNESEKPSCPRDRSRSIKLTEQIVEPLYIAKKARSGPLLHMQYQNTDSEMEANVRAAELKLMLHFLIRFHASNMGISPAPALSGFISQISQAPDRLTTIQYYPAMNHPITEYSTVRECLRVSERVSEEVGQQFTVNTFDLDVVMKALSIIWKELDIYKNHVILPGTMHIMMSAFRVLMKKMSGSGIEHVLLEGTLTTSGSIKGLKSGKSYYHSTDCHFTLAEACRRLIFERFQSIHGKQTELFDDIDKLVVTEKNVRDFLSRPVAQTFFKKYQEFENEMREGKYGKTSQFWLQYVDAVTVIELLYLAVKRNEFTVYRYCLHKLAATFFSFNGHNYARYLTYFSVFLMNIENSHPGAQEILERGAISVARSFIPGNRVDVDKTIEETFNRHAKSHSGQGSDGFGVSGLMTNMAAYHRFCNTTHERVRFYERLLVMAAMSKNNEKESSHLDAVNKHRSETKVRKAVTAIRSILNPFSTELDTENDGLYILSSGNKVPDQLANQILSAETRGRDARDKFIKDRLVEKSVDFFAPISKQKDINFDTLNKTVVMKTTEKKLLEVKQSNTIAFELLEKNSSPEQLKEIAKYPLMPVPSAIGTPDGFLLKNTKCKLRDEIVKDIPESERPESVKTLYIIDGHVIYHQLGRSTLSGQIHNFKCLLAILSRMKQKTCPNVDIEIDPVATITYIYTFMGLS